MARTPNFVAREWRREFSQLKAEERALLRDFRDFQRLSLGYIKIARRELAREKKATDAKLARMRMRQGILKGRLQ